MPSWNTAPPAEMPPAEMPSAGYAAKAIFLLCALPWITLAAVRTLYWTRRRSLDLAVEHLRSVPPFRWPYLRRPHWLCASVDRMLPLVPLRGFGPCLKRSLLLLDLWGRCELEPRLHLGIRAPSLGSSWSPGRRSAEGHAWISSAVDPAVSTSDQGYASGFSF